MPDGLSDAEAALRATVSPMRAAGALQDVLQYIAVGCCFPRARLFEPRRPLGSECTVQKKKPRAQVLLVLVQTRESRSATAAHREGSACIADVHE
ncbi:hypothetical protein EYF80_034265 [Liparis tanakae]|uniref:Uncharacterized protein n=1 Tax=Liparis tanakae TaxID=230148 RepID=A0A4Z2GRW3_9TELE|nr:hypothetical protein EYF80_034265 [Liparis tanakae]